MLRTIDTAAKVLGAAAKAASALGTSVLPFASRSGRVATTLLRPPPGAPTRRFRASAAARGASVAPAAGSDAKAVPSVGLVMVGDSKWCPFKHKELLSMDASDLLKALADSKVLGGYFKGVDLSACSVSILKLPADKEKPTADDERDAANVVEMRGAKSVGATAGSNMAGQQLCIRVQLPSPSGAAGAPPTARSPLVEWHGLLASKLSVQEVYAAAVSVAASAVRDSSLTVQEEAVLWNTPATSAILQKPLPVDTSNTAEKAVILELVDPVDANATTAALHERVWKALAPAFKSTAQRTSAVLLTGVSGAGKTKAAFDIGSKYAFVVMTRVNEQGLMTDPWQLLGSVTEKLQRQSVRRSESAADSLSSTAESESAVGALLLLLSCHLEWAVAVYNAAVAANPVLATDEKGRRVLRQAVLRAQRSGVGYSAVKALFAARLREVLDDPANVFSDGCVTVPLDAAKARLRRLNAQLPDMPVVWCYDEVQVLLTQSAFSNFFQGRFDASAFQSAPAPAPSAAAADRAAAGLPAAGDDAAGEDAGGGSGPSFYALSEDVAACNAELRRHCSRGWFYGLLVAMRHMVRDFGWGHLLCGSSLRLHRELLLAHSPAQGMCDSIDADVRLDAATIRASFEEYLTPAAAAGLDDRLIAQLVGRPLYASLFFQQLYEMLNSTLPEQEPKAVVATALRQAVATATAHAEKRVEELWGASFPATSGEQPQTLVAWLYYLQRMGLGTTTAITPPSMSSEVMNAVQRGVLHVGRNTNVVNLTEEPITAAAILAVGDLRTAAARSAAEDSVVRVLARRVTGAFGDPSAQGVTAEDVLAWTLLCAARQSPGISLRTLLSSIVGPSMDLVPLELDDHTVSLRSGLHSDMALGSAAAQRTFLDLLEAPGGDTLLVHHTQEKAAGAGLAFLVQRPGASVGAPPRQRLVLLQVKHAVEATAAKMLRSVDLGHWYPDAARKANGADGVVYEETPSHAAFRELMAAHPDWCDPVRVLVSARPWSESARQTAAWLNYSKVPQQPLLLAQVTKLNLGIDIRQGAAGGTQMDSPAVDTAWWPSKIRHWPTSAAHPQSALSAPPGRDVQAANVRPSHRVRFSAGPSRDLYAEAAAAGPYKVVEKTPKSLVVRFEHIGDAFRAVAAVAEGAAAQACDSRGKVRAWAAFER